MSSKVEKNVRMMHTDQPLQQLHAIVHGIVQGVNFRGYSHRKAVELKLSGWIRNLSNGTVETRAEGSQEALDAYLDWLNTGPPASEVARVDATWGEATGQFPDFRIRYF